MTKMTFREFQALLIQHGYDLPRFGADGYWGSETAEAVKRWAGSAETLDFGAPPIHPEPPRPMLIDDPVDPAWLPDAKMKRIHTHWTAGTHRASEYERTRYHLLIEGDGTVVRGTHSIKENERSGHGAQHTLNANTGAIGVALCACAGAVEVPYYAGRYPVTEDQWSRLILVCAQLSRRYGIPVTRATILSHCEVPKNLGIAQKNKWDIARVPFLQSTWTALGDHFRSEVLRLGGIKG